MKSGFITLIGKPNVGKSSLLNAIIGEKIAIMSPKPQTTRNNILGIYTTGDMQAIFIDTPGLHNAKSELNKKMVDESLKSLKGVDICILMVDCSMELTTYEKKIIDKIKNYTIPVFLVLNKIDLIKIDRSLALKEEIKTLTDDAEIIEMVAKDGFNVDELLKTIKSMLPDGPQYYDKDTISDMDVVFQIKEIIREKALNQLKDEVPHSLAVYMKNIEWEKNPLPI